MTFIDKCHFFTIILVAAKIYTCIVAVPPNVRNYFTPNISNPKWFLCPMECDCEEKFGDDLKLILSVSCYSGNLSHNVFAKIIKEAPDNITSLTVEAPLDNSNHFLWDDNLNRLKKLRTLRLINCGIPALSHSIDLRELEVLDLRLNKIEEISIDMFTEIPNLKSLDLSRNRLRVLPTGVFAFLRHMERLSLAYNDITELPVNLLHTQRNFKALHLDGNKIPVENLNGFIRDTKQLERLELNYCQLENIWDLNLEHLSNLRRVGLAGNMIGEVPTTLFRDLEQLNTIDLCDNDIREMPIDPLWKGNITRLFLAHNRLGNWQKLQNIQYYGPVKELDISYNNFGKFNTELLGTLQKTIEVLNLSGNRLRYIDSRLTNNLTALRILHLADNELSEIPSILPAEYSQLTLLNISKNAIYSLPYSSAEILPSLQILDISRNRFYNLHASLFESFINRLEWVYLYENPWDCECNIELLKMHMNERYRYKHSLKYDRTKCMTPETLRGTLLLNLNHITDCAVLFGARYGLTQATELGVLVALLLAISLFAALIILFAYYRREQKQKISYIDAHRSHSRTALTLSQHISRSPSSVIEPLTSSTDDTLPSGISTKIPPPPPPPTITAY